MVSCWSSPTSSAWRPAARSASTRSSTAARRCSSRRAISAGANGAEASSASGGPRHSPSASRSCAAAWSRVSGRERLAAVGDLAFEALGVELAGTHAQAVAGWRGDQHVGVVERLAQSRDVDLDGLDRAGRHVLAPQRDREALGADRLIGVQRQHRQHRARLGAAERHRTAVGAHLERTEDPELHHCHATLLPRAGGR